MVSIYNSYLDISSIIEVLARCAGFPLDLEESLLLIRVENEPQVGSSVNKLSVKDSFTVIFNVSGSNGDRRE